MFILFFSDLSSHKLCSLEVRPHIESSNFVFPAPEVPVIAIIWPLSKYKKFSLKFFRISLFFQKMLVKVFWYLFSKVVETNAIFDLELSILLLTLRSFSYPGNDVRKNLWERIAAEAACESLKVRIIVVAISIYAILCTTLFFTT